LKVKTYQMPRSFLCDVILLIEHLRGNYSLDHDTVNLLRSIDSQIDAKIDAVRKRDVFSRYKASTPGSDERESLRKDYLDSSHIHKDWRSPNEFFS